MEFEAWVIGIEMLAALAPAWGSPLQIDGMPGVRQLSPGEVRLRLRLRLRASARLTAADSTSCAQNGT
jgi:hypothetical protein